MASRYATAAPTRTADAVSAIPDPPGVCGCLDCNEAPFWVAAFCKVGSKEMLGSLNLARKRKGNTEKGLDHFSRRVGGGEWAATSDFTFIRWLARCTRCYMREQGM